MKNNKKIFLTLTLIVLLLGVSTAVAADNDTTPSTDVVSDTQSDTITATTTNTVDTTVESVTENKQIKKVNNKNLKKDPTTIDVYDTNTLTNALNTIKTDTTNNEFIINFNEGNYDFGNDYNIYLEATKTYTLNGNNQTLKAHAFSCTAANVKDITVINLNVEMTMSFGLGSRTGTGKIINSTITSPQLSLVCPTVIIDDYTELNNLTTLIYKTKKTEATFYTNNSQIISKFIELGVPEDSIISGGQSNSNDNQIIENITIDETKTYSGNNITLQNCNITANITTAGNITLNNCTIKAQITNNANLTLINCSLSNNDMHITSNSIGTIMYTFLLENNGNLTIIDCVIENNTFNFTSTYGYGDGAIIYNKNNAILLLNNTQINNNTYIGRQTPFIYNLGVITMSSG